MDVQAHQLRCAARNAMAKLEESLALQLVRRACRRGSLVRPISDGESPLLHSSRRDGEDGEEPGTIARSKVRRCWSTLLDVAL